MIIVNGKCHKKFSRVQNVFASNFENGDEIGAAITVFYQGKKVVDLWAGYKDRESKTAWEEDTIVPVFSVTKGITSFCFLILAARKKIDYDKPIGFYWNDFASNGKAKITVRQLLEHRAGLHVLDKRLLVEDFWKNPDKVYQALIEQKPKWSNGNRQAYSAQVWGAYTSEIFKQITGESVGTFFHREITKKLKLNIFLGLPENQRGKVAKIYPVSTIERLTSLIPHFLRGDDSEGRTMRAILSGNSDTTRAYTNPWVGIRGLESFNDPELQAAELLWANGITDARSLAFIYNILVTKGKSPKIKIANKSSLSELAGGKVLLYDEVIHKNLAWNLGFMKEEKGIFSPNNDGFGHPGMGGSLGWADIRSGLAIGYVCNKMNYRNRPLKTVSLCKAVYDSIENK